MYDPLLSSVSDLVNRDDRSGALKLLRAAIQDGSMAPRDGIELMLVIRGGSREEINEGVTLLRRGAAGAFRFVPKADHAFA